MKVEARVERLVFARDKKSIDSFSECNKVKNPKWIPNPLLLVIDLSFECENPPPHSLSAKCGT